MQWRTTLASLDQTWRSQASERITTHQGQAECMGGSWYKGKSDLYITRRTFNAARYVEALQEALEPHLPLGRHRFIQDGVPFHWTRVVSDWFAANRVRLVEDFPARSPDLNAVEYVWSWMKHTVAGHEPHDYDSLEVAIHDAWEKLCQTTIRHYIDHVSTVMREIIAAEGGHSH